MANSKKKKKKKDRYLVVQKSRLSLRWVKSGKLFQRNNYYNYSISTYKTVLWHQVSYSFSFLLSIVSHFLSGSELITLHTIWSSVILNARQYSLNKTTGWKCKNKDVMKSKYLWCLNLESDSQYIKFLMLHLNIVIN